MNKKFEVDILSARNFTSFGFCMSSRKSSTLRYRYAFNGMEKNEEWNEGSYDFGARMYDGRSGRWLAIDAMTRKHPSQSPFIFAANNPIVYIDVDGNDIRYFDMEGNEIVELRQVTDKVIATMVTVKIDFIYNEKGELEATHAFEEAKMPDRITNITEYEKNKGVDYNQYDYQIAASVFVFNKKLAAGKLPEKVEGTGSPTGVPKLDVNDVKAWILNESGSSGTSDVTQVNNSGDWSAHKTKVGLKKGVTPTAEQSIKSGILWLYYKGIEVSDVKWENGKIVSSSVTWKGGIDWQDAFKKYNGGGDANYLSKINAIKAALTVGKSKAFVDNDNAIAAKKAAKVKEDSIKNSKQSGAPSKK